MKNKILKFVCKVTFTILIMSSAVAAFASTAFAASSTTKLTLTSQNSSTLQIYVVTSSIESQIQEALGKLISEGPIMQTKANAPKIDKRQTNK